VVVDKLFADGVIDLKGQIILCGLILIIWQQELWKVEYSGQHD
jgi:hypothetical protein